MLETKVHSNCPSSEGVKKFHKPDKGLYFGLQFWIRVLGHVTEYNMLVQPHCPCHATWTIQPIVFN